MCLGVWNPLIIPQKPYVMKSFGNQRKTPIFQIRDLQGFVFLTASLGHAPKAEVAPSSPSSSLDCRPAICRALCINILLWSEVLRGVTGHSSSVNILLAHGGSQKVLWNVAMNKTKRPQAISGRGNHRQTLPSPGSQLELTPFISLYLKSCDLSKGSTRSAD